jgi:hypothetical protein
VPDAARVPAYTEVLRRELEIDLFEPTQPERIRAEAARLATDEKLDQRGIAKRLGVTQPAVGEALALDRMMRERGLISPYVPLASPPEDYKKLRRHKNPKYRFEPEEGYEPPPL